MASFSFSPVNWSGQTPGTSGTSHINSSAARGDRNAAKRTANAARSGGSPNTAQLLQGKTHTTSDFSMINSLIAGVQAGDDVALTALLVYPDSPAQRAVAAGRLAQHRRR